MRRLIGLVLMGIICLWPAACMATEVEEAEAETTETTEAIEVETPEQIFFGRLSEPGSSYTNSFKVKNNGAKELKLKLSFAASEYDLPDEAKAAAEWLAVVGGEVRQTVPAGEEKTIRLRATVPAEVKAGSQYATIMIGLNDQEERKIPVRLDVLGDDFKVTGDLRHSGVRIVNFGDKIHAQAEVENTGTGGFTVRNFVQAKKGLSGTAEWRTLVDEELEAVPGAKATMNSDAAEAVGYGWFTVEQKISYVNADGEMIEMTRSQLVLNCPWWAALIVGLLVLGGAVFLVVRKVKRKKATGESVAVEA